MNIKYFILVKTVIKHQNIKFKGTVYVRRGKVIGMVPYVINLFTEEKEMFSEINDVTSITNIRLSFTHFV